MIVRVQLFAGVKQVFGADDMELEVPDSATIADVRRALAAAAPDRTELIARSLFAINAEFASDADAVSASTEIACIPPVSGG